MIAVKGTPCGTVTLKEMVGEYEISIALDDSCGALQSMARGDVRVYFGREDVTDEVMFDVFEDYGTEGRGVVAPTIKNLSFIQEYLEELQM